MFDDQRLQALAAISPFAGLGDQDRAGIALRSTWLELPAGATLTEAGSPQESVWALVDGVVRGWAGTEPMTDYGPGQVVAELGTLDRRPWTVTVRARTPVTAVAVPRSGLDPVLADPVLAWELLVGIASSRSDSRSAPPRPPRLRHPQVLRVLTPAEQRVADLVADGYSNQEVAERLYLSRLTVETHLKRIFSKLGLRSRTALAAAVVAGLR